MNNKRFGKNNEKKRIQRKPPNFSLVQNSLNKPIDFNKEGYGQVNYDPIYGWLEQNYMGADAEGTVDAKYSTNQYRRVDGLPGSTS